MDLKKWYFLLPIVLVIIWGVFKMIRPEITGEDDSPTEENLECIIEETSGISIDLTPQSPEKK